MSRRRRNSSEKNSTSSKKPSKVFKGIWWKVLIVFFVIFIVGGVVVYNKVGAFLHSDSFREGVSEQISAKLGTSGELGKFTWSGLDGENESFKATGDGFIQSVEVQNISFDVDLDYIKRDKFTIKDISVSSLYAEVDLSEEFEKIELPKKEKGFIESLLPEEIEILDAKVHDMNAKIVTESGVYEVDSVTVTAIKSDDSYKASIDGGKVSLPFPFLESATIISGELTQLDEEIYIDDMRLNIFKSGEITMNGTVDLAPRSNRLYDVEGTFSGLQSSDVIPRNWQKYLTGEVEGKIKVIPRSGVEPKIEGHVEILNGQLRALPVLEIMAKHFSPDYLTIDFQTFECEFTKFRDHYEIRNLMLVSKGLIQVEGDLTIDGVDVDGVVNLGVPSENLSKLPGARGKVFKRGKDGLYWTRIKIGGSFGSITNDLKDRLIQAAIDAGIEDLLKIGPDAAKEILEEALEGGLPVESLQDMLKGGDGSLNGTDLLQGVLKGVTDAVTGEDKSSGIKIIPGLPIPGLPRLPDSSDDEKKEEESETPETPELPEIQDLPIPIPELPKLPGGIPLPF